MNNDSTKNNNILNSANESEIETLDMTDDEIVNPLSITEANLNNENQSLILNNIINDEKVETLNNVLDNVVNNFSASEELKESGHNNDKYNDNNIINNESNINLENTSSQNESDIKFDIPQPINNIGENNSDFSHDVTINDEELLKAFIGQNYKKITTKPFNFAGFFLTSFYLFYRKLFGYALLEFLLIVIIQIVIPNLNYGLAISFVFNILTGIFINKIYLSYANKKIAIIKAENLQNDKNKLKEKCAIKGGTSIGKVFLGLFTEFVISLVIFLIIFLAGFNSLLNKFLKMDFSNWNININKEENSSKDNSQSNTDILIENAVINGYSCVSKKCTIMIENVNGNNEEYVLNTENVKFIYNLRNYEDYIKLNIYYNEKGNSKNIINYKIFLKTTNQEIKDIKDENELRKKLGLYNEGTHTENLTFKNKGSMGAGIDSNNIPYSYKEYIFTNDKNIDFTMEYIDNDNIIDLIEGKKYKITFEVKKGTFDYEYIIKSIN